MTKLWQTSKVKMGEETIKSMKSRTQKRGYSKCVHMRTREKRVEKFSLSYVRYLVRLNIKGWTRQTQGALMSNHCLLSHH